MFLPINCHKTSLLVSLTLTLFDLNEEGVLLQVPKSLFTLQRFIFELLFKLDFIHREIQNLFSDIHETCLQTKLEISMHLNYTYVRSLHFKDFKFKVLLIWSTVAQVLQCLICKFSLAQLVFRFKSLALLDLHNQSRPHRIVPVRLTLLFFQVNRHSLVFWGQRFQWSCLWNYFGVH